VSALNLCANRAYKKQKGRKRLKGRITGRGGGGGGGGAGQGKSISEVLRREVGRSGAVEAQQAWGGGMVAGRGRGWVCVVGVLRFGGKS